MNDRFFVTSGPSGLGDALDGRMMFAVTVTLNEVDKGSDYIPLRFMHVDRKETTQIFVEDVTSVQATDIVAGCESHIPNSGWVIQSPRVAMVFYADGISRNDLSTAEMNVKAKLIKIVGEKDNAYRRNPQTLLVEKK